MSNLVNFSAVIIVILALFAVLEVALFNFLDQHYWLIPAFIGLNVFISWLLLKHVILKSFIFAYGQSFIVNRELKTLNE